MKNIVISGLGIVSPSGIGKNPFWANIKAGRSKVSTITRFDASRYPSHIAGQVDELNVYSNLPERQLKKMDVFSHMALVAADLALTDANVQPANENLDRVGIFVGNAIGGWLYAETELRDLYLEGREGVSPYMASAWFPAAPQGQLSIHYGIKGYSKTIVADRASSLMAIAFGASVVEKNKVDFILTGGMEAPVTPYALLCCNTYGSLTKRNHMPKTAYRPFDKTRDGFPIAEGAGIMVVEGEERAKKRGAHIYARITGFGTTCDGVDRKDGSADGKELARAINIALEDAGVKPEEIDYICADGAGTKIGDASETKAIKEVFGKRAYEIPVSAPKSMFGNMLGASGAVDTIITALSMEHNLVAPTINLEEKDPECDLNYVPNKAIEKTINKALIISRGRGGINACLVIEKYGGINND